MPNDELHSWLEDKLNHANQGPGEEISANVEWKKDVSTMTMRAGVTVTLKPSKQLKVTVLENGIDNDFVNGAINGALTELIGKPMFPMSKVELVISHFQIDEIGSSYIAFFEAAAEATRKCL